MPPVPPLPPVNVQLNAPKPFDPEQSDHATHVAGIAAGTQAASITSAHAIAKAMGCKVGLLFPTLSRDAESMVVV